ncbi:uncharacterized protein MELLADRAFT_102852 [Melampsora larici-populina 98AG31]|uniref:Uncharacterized protein n=1 Tax=Melampsora larici-populina (strain 98AG31 / pathotype 3-4-7) TaxID=747676 RepID=F4R9L6_MELLP|nr:uncharacterized protein MELLADRAFT_102852 [Melampsora larici-populina 98AG31]EGG11127.1 hypothetical protein MELLADRAFT_102852 [Melampsora larici-populina 98AG31]
MTAFDEFLDLMYGKEVPRKRTISHVESSVPIPVQPPAAFPKRAKVTPSQPLPYILTEKDMSLADFQKELNADKERLRRSTLQSASILDKSKSSQQTQALEQCTSFPTSAPTVTSENRSIPVSIPLSATPIVPQNPTPPYKRPSEPSPTLPTSSSPSSGVQKQSSCMENHPLGTVPLLRWRTRSASDPEPQGQGSPEPSQSHSI